MITLDLVNTVALAGVVLFLGYGIRGFVPPLARFNIPAPVIGGLLVAVVVTALRLRGVTLLQLDTTLQAPLMIAFFTSVGFGASVSLLRVGGPAVAVFLVLSTIAAVAQNVVGAGVAALLGQHPLMGVLAGSVTLTGGPATGLAFAPLFEKAGVPGAATLAVAAAMVGIVSGGLIGGPIGTRLIERLGVRPKATRARHPTVAENVVEDQLGERPSAVPAGEDVESYALLKALVVVLVAMWAGGWLSRLFSSWGLTLPAYIGAMLAAAALRNFDDVTGWLRLSQKVIDDLGTVALSLFLVLALMTLKLWELAGLALPLTAILVAQVLLVAALSLAVVPRAMGRDYDAAVMSSGFTGFMLGTTANAMANMGALVERYGPAPPRLPGGADGRGLLHRLHERAAHHRLPQHLPLTDGGADRGRTRRRDPRERDRRQGHPLVGPGRPERQQGRVTHRAAGRSCASRGPGRRGARAPRRRGPRPPRRGRTSPLDQPAHAGPASEPPGCPGEGACHRGTGARGATGEEAYARVRGSSGATTRREETEEQTQADTNEKRL